MSSRFGCCTSSRPRTSPTSSGSVPDTWRSCSIVRSRRSASVSSTWSASRHRSSVKLAPEEPDHLLGDELETVLDREVTGVEAMELGARKVREVRLAAFRGEEDVALAPEDDRLRLV